jgi:hypothetical protein
MERAEGFSKERENAQILRGDCAAHRALVETWTRELFAALTDEALNSIVEFDLSMWSSMTSNAPQLRPAGGLVSVSAMRRSS